jgi:DNA-binding NarL/FixJ family response regulator
MLLGAEPTIEIVAEATNGLEAQRAIEQTQPDVVLIDLSMPGLDGIEVIRQTKHPHAILLTNYVDGQKVRDAIAAGVKGYLLKDVLGDELIRAIRSVANGTPYLHHEAQQCLVMTMAKPMIDPFAELTARERDVLSCLSRGKSNKEIGSELGLTEGTVKGYVSAILLKLDLEDRTQAALLAAEHGLGRT